MICKHPAESLGRLPSGSYGCRACGFVADIMTTNEEHKIIQSRQRAPWIVRHPTATSWIIGVLTVTLGFLLWLLLIRLL